MWSLARQSVVSKSWMVDVHRPVERTRHLVDDPTFKDGSEPLGLRLFHGCLMDSDTLQIHSSDAGVGDQSPGAAFSMARIALALFRFAVIRWSNALP